MELLHLLFGDLKHGQVYQVKPQILFCDVYPT